MIAAGKAEGQLVKHELAAATCVGAGRMVQERPDAVEDLRAAVTSPGGRQAAIETMDGCDVKAALEAAVLRAAERCRELKWLSLNSLSKLYPVRQKIVSWVRSEIC